MTHSQLFRYQSWYFSLPADKKTLKDVGKSSHGNITRLLWALPQTKFVLCGEKFSLISLDHPTAISIASTPEEMTQRKERNSSLSNVASSFIETSLKMTMATGIPQQTQSRNRDDPGPSHPQTQKCEGT